MTERTAAAIAGRFEVLLGKIQPAASADGSARARVQRIRGALERAGYDVRRSAIVGSLQRGTAIWQFSDVDYFVVVPRASVHRGGRRMSSSTVLNNVRAAIQATYPTTDVGRDGSAVRIQFTRDEATLDVVPAIFEDPAPSGHPRYAIPDGEDGWLVTAPDLQARLVAAAQQASGHRYTRVVQLVKWWARSAMSEVPLSSIYVEMLLATHGIAVAQRYSVLIRDALRLLHAHATRPLPDPARVGSPLTAASTPRLVDQVRGSLSRAADHALGAVEAEGRGDLVEAARRWRILFGSSFPP